MDATREDQRQLRVLRMQLAAAMRRQPPDRAACVRLKAELKILAARVTHQACCPFCGRQLEIPPRSDPVSIRCKRCRNTFSYDPYTDQISVSRQPFQQNAERLGYKWITLWLAIILSIAVLAALAVHKPKIDESPAPASKGAPATAIDEIRRQLQSLAE